MGKSKKDEQNDYDYDSTVHPNEIQDETETPEDEPTRMDQISQEILRGGKQGNDFKKSVAIKRNDTKSLLKPIKHFAQSSENGIHEEEEDSEYEDSTKANKFENKREDEEYENQVSTERDDIDYGDSVHNKKRNNLKHFNIINKGKKEKLSDSVQDSVQRFTNSKEEKPKLDEEPEMEYDYESTQEMDDAKENILEDKNGEQEDSREDMYMMKNENPEHESSLEKNIISTSNVFEDVSKAFMQERETENSLYNSGTEFDSGLGSTTLDDPENLNIGRKYRNMKRYTISKKYSKRAKLQVFFHTCIKKK